MVKRNKHQAKHSVKVANPLLCPWEESSLAGPMRVPPANARGFQLWLPSAHQLTAKCCIPSPLPFQRAQLTTDHQREQLPPYIPPNPT